MELSCLHLGFYLASWGMLRGSSVLLRRKYQALRSSHRRHRIGRHERLGDRCACHTDESIERLTETATHLRSALPEGASDILVTKILLGVFGCVPAFDTYFKKGFGVSTFGRKSLSKVGRFYQDNSEVIEAHRVPTLDFGSGTETTRKYTRAKVIDMIFFVEGGL
jgi:hypothetical protein